MSELKIIGNRKSGGTYQSHVESLHFATQLVWGVLRLLCDGEIQATKGSFPRSLDFVDGLSMLNHAVFLSRHGACKNLVQSSHKNPEVFVVHPSHPRLRILLGLVIPT